MRWVARLFIPLAAGLPVAGCSKDAPAVAVVYERRFADGTTCTERLYIAGARIRIESCQTEPMSVVIFDPGRFNAVRLFPALKQYRVVLGKSEAEPEAERPASGPYDAPKRQLFRLIIDSIENPEPPTLEATEVERRVAGHACRVYRVLHSERVSAEVCLADWDHVPVSASAMRALKPLCPTVALDELPGFPMSSLALQHDGSAGEGTTVVSVHAGALAAELFEIPADYREAP